MDRLYQDAWAQQMTNLDKNEELELYNEETFDTTKNCRDIEFAIRPMDKDQGYPLIKDYLQSTIVVVPNTTRMVDLKEYVLKQLQQNPRLQGIQRKDV